MLNISMLILVSFVHLGHIGSKNKKKSNKYFEENRIFTFNVSLSWIWLRISAGNCWIYSDTYEWCRNDTAILFDVYTISRKLEVRLVVDGSNSFVWESDEDFVIETVSKWNFLLLKWIGSLCLK